MRVHKLVHAVLFRFSGMDESEGIELQGEAQQAYKDALAEAKSKELQNKQIVLENYENSDKEGYQKKPLLNITVADRMIMFAEKWYTRYGFAAIAVWIIPIIRDYMNDDGGQTEDTEMDMLEMFRLMAKAQKNRKI